MKLSYRPAQQGKAFLFAALAGVGLYTTAPRPVQAAENQNLAFVLPDNDGYGVSECMKPGMDCGRVIADAWCEAHGLGPASAFGLSDDVTGSTKISTAVSTPVAPGSVVIQCGE